MNWLRSDGAGETQRLLETKSDVRPYSFSPDGKRLIFVQVPQENPFFDLWTLPLDSSDLEHPKPGQPEILLKGNFDINEASLSYDGHWIAYRANTQSGVEIYVQPFPVPSGKWLIGNGRFPIWSRNGKELFYVAFDNRIMVTSYSAKGDSFAPDKSRVWSSVPVLQVTGATSLDLAPDGKRFVTSPGAESLSEQKGSVQVTVLLNFFDELRRRMAGK